MKKNYTTLLILAAAFLSGACRKQLNVFPTTAEVDGNLIKDEASARAVLNGVYYRFANTGQDAYGYNGVLWSEVNEAIPSELAGTIYLGYRDPFDSLNITPNSFFSDLIWNYAYALVNAANGFIKNLTPVASIPAATRQQMLAEARFLRAFGNSELLLYYGQYNDTASKYGIIMRDEFVTAANVSLPRSSVADAYKSILADLDGAIQGLPARNTTMYYANVSAAKLLKARVLMNRGKQSDYSQVTSLTSDIIANDGFALEDSLKEIFLTKGFSSKEIIMGVQPQSDQTVKFDRYTYLVIYVATDSMVSLLKDDARNQWVYKYAFIPYHQYFYNEMTKYYSGDPTNLAFTSLSEYCYAFRLSEAYLLKAEALTLSNGDLANAKELLTTVMSHAGAGSGELAAVAAAATPGALQIEIVKENMRNFAYENGIDWFALRRLPFAEMQRLNPTISDPRKLILPIPSTELDYNNVIQNPGY